MMVRGYTSDYGEQLRIEVAESYYEGSRCVILVGVRDVTAVDFIRCASHVVRL